MTDRPSMAKGTGATRGAFRAGVKGTRYTENSDPDFDIPVATDTLPGPNELHFAAVEILPGLSNPEAAYETGRALRMIGHILDRHGSPIEHGQLFLSKLSQAVAHFASIGKRQPWGAEDTAFIFGETFKVPPSDARQAHEVILAYARKRPPIVKGR